MLTTNANGEQLGVLEHRGPGVQVHVVRSEVLHGSDAPETVAGGDDETVLGERSGDVKLNVCGVCMM